jgi:demethylmenaquinone methyltransferase/2-methoxy-6-polyprenyl-1,4-benzoquinol methylase
MARVLRPGGRLVILEITRPQREPLASFYSLWFDRLVPVIGSLAGDPDAYSYLPNSVRSFPDPQRLAEMIDAAGFAEIRWLLVAGGIIAIHSATKTA